MASSKSSSKSILDLTEAYDEGRKKRYKKGKFLGKVSSFSVCNLMLLVRQFQKLQFWWNTFINPQRARGLQ